jgi:uncharacterized protein YcfJ
MIKHTVAIALLATPSVADDKQKVTNVYVEDHYSTYYEFVTDVERVCNKVNIPVYGTKERSATAGDVLGGALIGGLLGGTASGKDEGAALGAFIGGVIAGESKKKETVVIGYREEVKCDNVTKDRKVERVQYDYSSITFTLNGDTYSVVFSK